VRAQVDTVGFAARPADLTALLAAVHAAEDSAVAARRAELALPADAGWAVAIMPHDDYLYAGRVYAHVTPGLRAPRWIVLGVCHACRRLGVRDRLLFDDFDAWRVAGSDVPVDAALRARLLAALGPDAAVVARDRQAAEHSVEALLPWLRDAVPDAVFVPILVPGMSWERLEALSARLADALADLCRERGWTPGRDIGLLISADAVHYGCRDWGPGGGHHPFGCDAAGHAAARARDLTLAEATLAGPLTAAGPAAFARLVWKPGDPADPYLITWCGLYSIPCGLETARRLQAALGLPPLAGHLLRYGDSVSDPPLAPAGVRLGVTAPADLEHWVGYAAVGWPATP
ncbi:MAG: AmmeMemoRadiSam system protein B, partial [Candidatus Krumholzibacteriia bacterium]